MGAIEISRNKWIAFCNICDTTLKKEWSQGVAVFDCGHAALEDPRYWEVVGNIYLNENLLEVK